MVTYSDFFTFYTLKNRATSEIKIKEVLNNLELTCSFYLRDSTFKTNIVIVNIPTKGKHWVAFMIEVYFDSLGCSPPETITDFPTKRNGKCVYSEYEIDAR